MRPARGKSIHTKEMQEHTMPDALTIDQDQRAIDALRRDVATWRAIAQSAFHVIHRLGKERDAARRTMAERLGWVIEEDIQP